MSPNPSRTSLQPTNAADEGVGLTIPGAVSTFAGSLVTVLGWAIGAPSTVIASAVTGVSVFSGVLTAAWLRQRLAKRRAADERRRLAAERRKQNSSKMGKRRRKRNDS